MEQHTPGPWVYQAGSRWVYEESTGASVARVCEDDGHVARPRLMPTAWNARLIAAAPDLLAACEAVFAAFGLKYTLPLGFPAEIELALRAAISKARGN